MDKELFIYSMEQLKIYLDREQEINSMFDNIFSNDYITGIDNGTLLSAYMNILKKLTKDDSGWIEYFVWDLDFGKDYKDGCITENGVNVKLDTIESLWNIINHFAD